MRVSRWLGVLFLAALALFPPDAIGQANTVSIATFNCKRLRGLKPRSFALEHVGAGSNHLPLRAVWPAYSGPSSDLLGRELIRMTRETTLDTLEYRLAGPAALVDAPARRAGAARVPRIDSHAGNARGGALVFEEGAQLMERPAAVLVPLRPANRYPVADALEVF
jgi:hypothetical protein